MINWSWLYEVVRPMKIQFYAMAALPSGTVRGTHWLGGVGVGPTVTDHFGEEKKTVPLPGIRHRFLVVQTQPDHYIDWATSPVGNTVRVTWCHQYLYFCCGSAVVEGVMLTGKSLCNGILNFTRVCRASSLCEPPYVYPAASAWKSAKSIGRIFVKFCIWNFY